MQKINILLVQLKKLKRHKKIPANQKAYENQKLFKEFRSYIVILNTIHLDLLLSKLIKL